MPNRLTRGALAVIGILAVSMLLSFAGAPTASAKDHRQRHVNKIDTHYDEESRTARVSARHRSPSGSGSSTGFPVVCDKTEEVCRIPDPVDPGTAARSAVAQLTLPVNIPRYGPQPNQNQWGIIPVGYPVWLWTSSTTTTLQKSVTQDGLSISLTARRQKVSFDMGDGSTVACTDFTTRPAKLTGDPRRPSPTCGHEYQVTGQFQITATTSWLISWQSGGQTGQFQITDSASAAQILPVGELLSVITEDSP